MTNAAQWHESQYAALGLGAQRRYPNEELIRFMGRRFFHRKDRADIKILEVGCGTGANLHAIAKEGFDAYGLDTSESAIAICGNHMARAKLKVGDMCAMPVETSSVDCVLDVFSSYCLDEQQFSVFLGEVRRVLKPDGLFFSYTPGKWSDAFKSGERIDGSAVNGIPEGFAYGGNQYPFRFISASEYRQALTSNGFTVEYLESVTRTYRGGSELFEFIVVEAQRGI